MVTRRDVTTVDVKDSPMRMWNVEDRKRAFRVNPNEFDTAVVLMLDGSNVRGVVAEGTYDECLDFLRRRSDLVREGDTPGLDLMSLRTGRLLSWVL